MEKRHAPVLRLKGFTDDWEQRKLGSIVCDYSEKNPVDEDLPILTSSRQGIQKQEEHFGSEQRHDTIDYNVIPRGYCTYRNRSDDRTFTFNVNDCIERGIVSKFYPVFSIDNGNAKFVTEYLNNNFEIKNKLAVLSVGTSQVVLSLNNLKSLDIQIPSKDEQEKIGGYLNSFDNLITLHQRKLEKLQNIKKAMLEKMFPKNEEKTPKIRFSGFTSDWEQRKLGECFSERVESMPDGELISVTISDGIKKFSELSRHDNSNDDKSKYKKVCVGDIAYNSMRMWQGASGYSFYDGIVSPAYTVLSPNNGVLSKCVAYQFKLPQMIHTFQIHSQGITSDNWNLKYPALREIEIKISENLQEQKKIADFFNTLDTLITLHQRKLEKLQNIKKAMLEKMFV